MKMMAQNVSRVPLRRAQHLEFVKTAMETINWSQGTSPGLLLRKKWKAPPQLLLSKRHVQQTAPYKLKKRK
ncbi:hypothetical protein D2V93_02750 [Flagellimonas taeanensis]|nr:hypothetical protein D2V93_02750 [Allomuricauda taeanensis]